jgi:hypothetical protein
LGPPAGKMVLPPEDPDFEFSPGRYSLVLKYLCARNPQTTGALHAPESRATTEHRLHVLGGDESRAFKLARRVLMARAKKKVVPVETLVRSVQQPLQV